jgi:acetyl-CoA C-acetyltransferase
MTQAVIVSAVRTAIGTGRKGTLANTSAEELALAVIRGALARAAVDPSRVDDVLLAEAGYGGGAVARYAAVEAGLTTAAGMAVSRHCAGSLSAVGLAAASVLSGMERIVIAGGVMSASTSPQMRRRIPGTEEVQDPWLPPSHPDSPEAPNGDMTITVGWNAARAAELTRQAQDAWAFRSHQRAVAAIDAGHFVDEIIPVMARLPDGGRVEFKVDEHPRRDTTLEKLASLKVIHPEIEGFSITAGNSSGVNDAASAMVVTTSEVAAADRLQVQATIRGWTALGIEPARTGLAVPGVVEKLFARTGVTSRDIALWEINEAFASVPLAASRALRIDEETINVSGSGCSLGHPVAGSGARMITTLINDLRRRGGGLGVATMCAAGGQAGAVLIEV